MLNTLSGTSWWRAVAGLAALPIAVTAGAGPDRVPPMDLQVIVAPGAQATFEMGSNDADLEGQPTFDDPDFYTDDEKPRHRIVLTVPYAIGRYEVTNQQYADVMNEGLAKGSAVIADGNLETPAGIRLLGVAHVCDSSPQLCLQLGLEVTDGRLAVRPGMHDHPVHSVSWYGAVVFCNLLSEAEGLDPVYDLKTWQWDRTKRGYRLPTEAEWEYAARKDKRHTYAWGDTISVEYANYAPSLSVRPKDQITMPVGFFDGTTKDGLQTRSNASPFGVFDLTGSLWEWCWDWYGRTYFRDGPTTDPAGPAHGDDRPPYAVTVPTRVWRGGGYAAPEGWARVGKRFSMTPETTVGETGFRAARTLP